MGRASVNRIVQAGVETTPGSAVAANKQFPTMSLRLSRSIDVQQFRAQGYKLPTAAPIVHVMFAGQRRNGLSMIVHTGVHLSTMNHCEHPNGRSNESTRGVQQIAALAARA